MMFSFIVYTIGKHVRAFTNTLAPKRRGGVRLILWCLRQLKNWYLKCSERVGSLTNFCLVNGLMYFPVVLYLLACISFFAFLAKQPRLYVYLFCIDT